MFTLILTIIALVCVAALPIFYMVPCSLEVSIPDTIESHDGERWALALEREIDLDAALAALEEGWTAPQPKPAKRTCKSAPKSGPRRKTAPMVEALCDNVALYERAAAKCVPMWEKGKGCARKARSAPKRKTG